MRARFAVEALLFVASAWATSAWAHDIDEVRSMLRQQGFDQLEFQRTKPPFKLDACRGGERFHLHVDYYGKVLEQTSIGSCGEDASKATTAGPPPAAAPTDAFSDENSSIASPAASITSPAAAEPPKPSLDAKAPAEPASGKELCSRYFPEVGKTLRVPCDR